MVLITICASIPAAFAAKTPQVTGTLGKGDYGVMDDTPYYGGFGAGFLHINADGTYGGGEIRSGDLGLSFYGPTFGGPYRFQLNMKDAKGEWNGDLVAGGAEGMQVEYLPLFPTCQYTFKHQAMPLDVKMEAFAPWIPGDSKMSSLPVLFFEFQITNPDESDMTVSLACMVPNPECDGGSPVRDQGGQVDGLLLQSKRAGGGTLCGMIRNDGAGEVTCGAEFTKGKLSGTNGNLLASSIVVPAKSTRHIVFILAWDFPVYVSGDGKAWPRKELGHYHSNFYQGADAIARNCELRYQSVPGTWHVLLGLEGVRWDVPGKKLSLRPNLPASFQGKLRTFLPGAVTWGGLDYSCVETDCDQRYALTFERPFELEFLGVRNSGKPTVRATQDGKAVPCSIKAVNADEYEVRFDKPLKLDGKPLEVRIGSK